MNWERVGLLLPSPNLPGKNISICHVHQSLGGGEPFNFQRILKSKLTVLCPGTVSIKALIRYSDLSVKKKK